MTGVEVFAMNYAQRQLKDKGAQVLPVDKQEYGHDLEAEHQGEILRIEVKGQTEEKDVELRDNELKAAYNCKHGFALCVVCGIPENPAAHLLRGPASQGKSDRLTIPQSVWKSYPFQ